MTSILKRDDQMAIPPSRSLVLGVSATATASLKPILPDFRIPAVLQLAGRGRKGWQSESGRGTFLAIPLLTPWAGAVRENGRVRQELARHNTSRRF
jgi:hypothetical protein